MTTPRIARSWQRIPAADLLEALEHHYLSDLLERRSAIYMWKKALDNSTMTLRDGKYMLNWLDSLLATPHGGMTDQHVGTYLHFGTIELKPYPLPQQIREAMTRWGAKQSNRHWMNAFLTHLAQHTPSLYVGETGNLQRRVAEHLHAETDFGEFVAEYLSWPALDLHYYDLGSESTQNSQIRKSLEYITNSLTLGGYTKRPG